MAARPARSRAGAAKSFLIPASPDIRKFSPTQVTPDRLVCLTYPHIGNVGANLDDEEAKKPYIESLIVREFSQISSNWRSAETAQLYLNRHKIPAIWDIDTRALVRHIRKVGALRGVVATDGTPADQLIHEAKQIPSMTGQELASRVSCAKQYMWNTGSIDLATSPWAEQMGEAGTGGEARNFRVVAYDFGIKQNILRLLVDHHCEVCVVPAQTTAKEILEMGADGVFLSNGPGDPEPVEYAVENIRNLIGRVPVFGICLGHQLCGPRARRKNLQAEIRPSRFESPGKELTHRASRNHRPKSWLLRRPRFATVERSRNHPHKPERPNQRRHAPQIPPTIQRPISPGSQPRPPRFALPLHPIHRHDAGIPEARELTQMKTIPVLIASLFFSFFANAECTTVRSVNPQPSFRNVSIIAFMNGKPAQAATVSILLVGKDLFSLRTDDHGVANLPAAPTWFLLSGCDLRRQPTVGNVSACVRFCKQNQHFWYGSSTATVSGEGIGISR